MNAHTESGNVLFIILIAIGLFASLAFVVTRSAQNENTTAMTEREARLAGTDIVNYTQQIERAVSRLRQKGISENDISFANNEVSGYEYNPVKPAKNNVYHRNGGGAKWRSPVQQYNDGSEWLIIGNTCVSGIGRGGSDCHTDSESNEELLLILPNVKEEICENITIASGLVASVPDDSGNGYSTSKFTGSYSDGTIINIGTNPPKAGCFKSGLAYHYYHVLIER